MQSPSLEPFTPEPITEGFGFYHINRFRICLKPSGQAALLNLQKNLLDSMPSYMDADTARVVLQAAPIWQGRKTLMFYGVPVIRPFDGPIAPNLLPPGLAEIAKLLPERLRGIKLPALHTDSVGVLDRSVTDTGFTVQTLKRNFTTPEDETIRKQLGHVIDAALVAEALTNPVGAYLDHKYLKQKLLDYVIWVNQHHFLAGRRSFRFVPGEKLGYTDGRIVFETAAVERYAKLAFAAPSEAMMGGDKKALEVVWVEMATRVAGKQAVLPPRSAHPTLAHDGHWAEANKNKQVLEFYTQALHQGSVGGAAGDLLADAGVHPLLFRPQDHGG